MGDESGHAILWQVFGVMGSIAFLAMLVLGTRRWVTRKKREREAAAKTAAVALSKSTSAQPCLGCDIVKPLRQKEPVLLEHRDLSTVAPSLAQELFGTKSENDGKLVVGETGDPCLCNTCGPLARSLTEEKRIEEDQRLQAAVTARARSVSDFNAFGLREALRTSTALQKDKQNVVMTAVEKKALIDARAAAAKDPVP